MASIPLSSAARKPKPVRGKNMEGFIATLYAKNTAPVIPQFEAEARRYAAILQPGAEVLEVAPGPGYLAVALAKAGDFRVSALDYSHAFVRIGRENAAHAGVQVDFRQGNASDMPYAANSFDLLICRAAFKNFGDPVGALREMHRVLKPGGTAVIIDMRKNATRREIYEEVDKMNQGAISAAFTRLALRDLRRRAYTRAEFERMIAETPFGTTRISEGGIGFEIRLGKPA
jgi:ubiquinone/menaquinone biosynthesis C-methylase UbiE